MLKPLLAVLFLLLFLSGAGLLLRHLWLRSSVQQRWDNFREPEPTQDDTDPLQMW